MPPPAAKRCGVCDCNCCTEAVVAGAVEVVNAGVDDGLFSRTAMASGAPVGPVVYCCGCSRQLTNGTATADKHVVSDGGATAPVPSSTVVVATAAVTSWSRIILSSNYKIIFINFYFRILMFLQGGDPLFSLNTSSTTSL